MFFLYNKVPKELRFYIFIISLIIFGLILLLTSSADLSDSKPDLCIFHKVTGIACPGCGMGRSVYSLMQFKIIQAFYFNPFSVPVFLIGITLPFWIAYDFIKKKKTLYNTSKRIDAFILKNKILLLLLLLLIIANWIWNIYKF